MLDPHAQRPDRLNVTPTPNGALGTIKAAGVLVTVRGQLTEDEAAAMLTAALRALAKVRGREPRLLADRDNPQKLRERLSE